MAASDNDTAQHLWTSLSATARKDKKTCTKTAIAQGSVENGYKSTDPQNNVEERK